MQNAAKAYLKTQVNTNTSADILLMLYDGAIKFLKQAKIKIDERDVAAKGLLLSRAMEIIGELQASLNKEKGGSLADNLLNLYFLCSTKILQANLRMDKDLIDEVIHILTGLRDAFAQINGQVTPEQQQKAAAQGLGKATGLGASGFPGGPRPTGPAPAPGIGAPAQDPAPKTPAAPGAGPKVGAPTMSAVPKQPEQPKPEQQAAAPQQQPKPEQPAPQTARQQPEQSELAAQKTEKKPEQPTEKPQEQAPKPVNFLNRRAAQAYGSYGK
jgi:flagellar protein FliS